jgi:hypothetical protein
LGNSRTSKNVQSLDTLHLIKLDEPTKYIRQHLNTMLSSRKRKGKNLKRKRKSGTEIERERERKRERKREREKQILPDILIQLLKYHKVFSRSA